MKINKLKMTMFMVTALLIWIMVTVVFFLRYKLHPILNFILMILFALAMGFIFIKKFKERGDLDVKKRTKFFKSFQLALILFLLIGAILNIVAVASNGLKMPVLQFSNMSSEIDSTIHYYVNSLEEVNFPSLIDKFYFDFYGTLSLGDFFILISVFFLSIIMIADIMIIIKKIRRKKNEFN